MLGGRGLDSSGSGLGAVADSCEHGNEHFGFIKDGIFYCPSDCQLFKKACTPWSYLLVEW
jgi:hypothetical protein